MSARGQRPRARTISIKEAAKEVAAHRAVAPHRTAQELERAQAERPRTRGECQDGPRPCPFVSCKFHLYLDVSPATGSIKFNFPGVEPEDLVESCALDVADRGPVTLEEVGAILNLTRERVRQMEVRGLVQLKTVDPRAFDDD